MTHNFTLVKTRGVYGESPSKMVYEMQAASLDHRVAIVWSAKRKGYGVWYQARYSEHMEEPGEWTTQFVCSGRHLGEAHMRAELFMAGLSMPR